MMGSVLGDVGAAVMVPGMADLEKRGLIKTPAQKNIFNLILASGNFDDVLMVTVFQLCSGIIFSEVSGPVSTGMRAWHILSSLTRKVASHVSYFDSFSSISL